MSDDTIRQSPLSTVMASGPGDRLRWTQLYASAKSLAIATTAHRHDGPVLVVTPDTQSAMSVTEELEFYLGKELPILQFPDWETLPYDMFSPHHDIISQRLATLNDLPSLRHGVVVVPISTMMARVAPKAFLVDGTLTVGLGERLELDKVKSQLTSAGYRHVGQVMEHGEFAVRGSLLDLFPMGAALPIRIDLFDDEVETLRTFDPETQRTIDKIETLRLIPAREFPTDSAGIARFRRAWRAHFEGDPNSCPVYRDVSEGLLPSGIEYYLPLFFESTETLFDYFPTSTLGVVWEESHAAGEAHWAEVSERYEQRAYDIERPVLKPNELYLSVDELFAALKRHPVCVLGRFDADGPGVVHYASRSPTHLPIEGHADNPLALVEKFLADFDGRVLFVAQSAGRREVLLQTLGARRIRPTDFDDWASFLDSSDKLGLTVSAIAQGAVIEDPKIAVITEYELFGERALRRRDKRRGSRDAESIVRDLSELTVGAPVVHEHHGVGRYLGLESLNVGGMDNEFLALAYAGDDKLYVPVSSIDLISRYTGSDPDHAPLHRLGSGQWQKARSKAAEKARDVAAELLEIYARRAARKGHRFELVQEEYQRFCDGFPFAETSDQLDAIHAVMENMLSDQPMDRLVCGDVGFGKTEVAMRAAFIAVQDGRQVAILVPTTLLAQQHHQSFLDRFADWPVNIEVLSRFRNRDEQTKTIKKLAGGGVDILIGTHKLLNEDVRFKRLGLVIVDEEHRFGVRQKERLKALRAEVDILTLTATPIPRTLNMALSGLRDLTLITTPPEKRLSIKTFVRQWQDALVREACLRELHRGGQVFFVHNRVEDINKIAETLQRLVPEAQVQIAHGQMRERDLEHVMLDFYHRRFNILVCTTIIETGIDVPNANTMIINRADRFGLAQLHQLRGRVGRSHHRAYAYMVIPPRNLITADAVKRLEAIESLEDLGIGFSLATHDLEIRGAGELLGDEQSGQIHEVGYSLYTRLLERAVDALRAGRSPELDRPLDHGTEIDLQVPALIPEHYLPDVHARLMMYKKIASAKNHETLQDVQVEMIDRFGLLPDATRALFRIAELKLRANPLGIRKIEMGTSSGRLVFSDTPNVDPSAIIRLIQDNTKTYRLDGPERLKIHREFDDLDDKVEFLVRLFDKLQIPQAA